MTKEIIAITRGGRVSRGRGFGGEGPGGGKGWEGRWSKSGGLS